MKKITYLATICGLILLGLSSCQKEKLNGGQFTATISQMNNDGKVTYDGQGFAWQPNDKIIVFRHLSHVDSTNYVTRGAYVANLSDGESNAVQATFSYVPETGGVNDDVTNNARFGGLFYAKYPYELSVVGDNMVNISSVRLPSSQTLVPDDQNNLILVGFPMYAESSDRHLKFKNLCGLLKLHLQKANTTVSAITISTEDANLNGRFSIEPTRNAEGELTGASLSPILSNDEDRAEERKIVLVQFPAQNIANGKDFFIALPARDYHTLTITITDDNGAVCTKSLNSTHTFHVGASEWSSITLQNDDLVFEEVVIDEIEGALSGLFSVSERQQVVFSRGNLQYRPSDNTYQFADNQYDRNSYEASTDYSSLYDTNSTEWIELFHWGTSGYNNKYPYYYSATPSDYGNGANSLTGLNANYDWGVYNGINGGDAGIWRTLTQPEWNYLFTGRTNAAQKWTKATVNGVYGTIIVPDTWNKPSTINMTMAKKDWTTNQYNTTQWELLEEAGAVFLPTTGYLSYNSSSSSDYYFFSSATGYYWTATNSSTNQAKYLSVSKSSNSSTGACERGRMLAVRLVHDVD